MIPGQRDKPLEWGANERQDSVGYGRAQPGRPSRFGGVWASSARGNSSCVDCLRRA